MGRHAVMGHCAPGMVPRRGLREPDVARIARELTAFQCANHRVAVDDLAARRIHEVATALHHADKLVVEHVLGLWVQWRIDRDYIADLDERLDRLVIAEPKLFLQRLRQSML